MRLYCERMTWWPYVDGATHERAAIAGLADNVEQVRIDPVQCVDLGDATCEVLKALCGGSSRQRLVAAI